MLLRRRIGGKTDAGGDAPFFVLDRLSGRDDGETGSEVAGYAEGFFDDGSLYRCECYVSIRFCDLHGATIVESPNDE